MAVGQLAGQTVEHQTADEWGAVDLTIANT